MVAVDAPWQHSLQEAGDCPGTLAGGALQHACRTQKASADPRVSASLQSAAHCSVMGGLLGCAQVCHAAPKPASCPLPDLLGTAPSCKGAGCLCGSEPWTRMLLAAALPSATSGACFTPSLPQDAVPSACRSSPWPSSRQPSATAACRGDWPLFPQISAQSVGGLWWRTLCSPPAAGGPGLKLQLLVRELSSGACAGECAQSRAALAAGAEVSHTQRHNLSVLQPGGGAGAGICVVPHPL